MSARASFSAAALACVLATAWPAQGALPTTYGGTFTLPSLAPLRAPDPRDARTPLEAALARAVYDTLYDVDGAGRPRPALAAAMPEPVETEDGTPRFRIALREGIRRHDRRPLVAADVVASLRQASRSRAKPWLVGMGPTPAQPDLRADGEHAVVVAWGGRAEALATRLAAAPLALVLRARNGTGPYRARLRSSELRLSQFRSAARGAPYLRRIVVRPPAEREAELRAFELERLDGSWRGAALYGQPRRPVQELTLPQTVPVAIALGPRARPHAAAIAGALDRRRLARVGIAPSDALPGLPAPRLRGNDRPSRSLVLVADGADQFQVALAAALEARFDEQRWSVDVQRLEGSALARALASGRWDLRIVQAPPALPGSRNAIASLLVALGDAGGASAVIEGRTTPADAASGVGAIVLGARRSALHTVATLQGAGFDPLGRLRFERLHVRATEDEGGSE